MGGFTTLYHGSGFFGGRRWLIRGLRLGLCLSMNIKLCTDYPAKTSEAERSVSCTFCIVSSKKRRISEILAHFRLASQFRGASVGCLQRHQEIGRVKHEGFTNRKQMKIFDGI